MPRYRLMPKFQHKIVPVEGVVFRFANAVSTDMNLDHFLGICLARAEEEAAIQVVRDKPYIANMVEVTDSETVPEIASSIDLASSESYTVEEVSEQDSTDEGNADDTDDTSEEESTDVESPSPKRRRMRARR